jgi:hypothetical protein
MGLTDEQNERLEFWIKNTFYYLEYPDPVQGYWWKDREENWTFMKQMRLDHLKASAKLIERDIKSFMKSHSKKDSSMDVYEKYLLLPAQKKKLELEEVLKEMVLA